MKKLALKLLIKWLLVPILLLVMVLVLVFRVTEGEVDGLQLQEYSAPNTNRAYVYSLLKATTTTEDTSNTVNNVDSTEFYSDASDVVGDRNGSNITTQFGAGFDIYDGPSKERSEFAFVVNAKPLQTHYFSDLKEIGQNIGLDVSSVDVDALVKDYYAESHGAIIAAQESVSESSGIAGGAVPPALVCRDYEADERYVEAGWRPFWLQFDGDSGPGYMDIMVVKNEDWDAYYAGESVPVYYIPFNISDAKGHAYPWGVAQTYITISGPRGNYLYKSQSGGMGGNGNSGIQIGSGSSIIDEMTRYYQNAPSSQYWLPMVVENELSQFGRETVLSSTGCQIEPYANGPSRALARFLGKNDSQYAIVGYLVYATRDNPPQHD